jgi:hypothetical protein
MKRSAIASKYAEVIEALYSKGNKALEVSSARID